MLFDLCTEKWDLVLNLNVYFRNTQMPIIFKTCHMAVS